MFFHKTVRYKNVELIKFGKFIIRFLIPKEVDKSYPFEIPIFTQENLRCCLICVDLVTYAVGSAGVKWVSWGKIGN